MPDDGVLTAHLSRAQLEQIRQALERSAEVARTTAELFKVVRGTEVSDDIYGRIEDALELVDVVIDDLVERQQDAYRDMMSRGSADQKLELETLLQVSASRLPQVPLDRAVGIRIVDIPLDLVDSDRRRRRVERRYARKRAETADQRVAQRKAREMLLGGLARWQREDYERTGSFEVVGGTSGKRYRIYHGQVQNILELDESGQPVRRWCCHPPDVPEEDAMLAQKLHLESNEEVFLQTANLIGGRRPDSGTVEAGT